MNIEIFCVFFIVGIISAEHIIVPKIGILIVCALLLAVMHSTAKHAVYLPNYSRKKQTTNQNNYCIIFSVLLGFAVGNLIVPKITYPCENSLEEAIVISKYKTGLVVESPKYGRIVVWCLSNCPIEYSKAIVKIEKPASAFYAQIFGARCQGSITENQNTILSSLRQKGSKSVNSLYIDLRRVAGEDISGLLVEMLFGGRFMSDRVEEIMRKVGLLHITAISGANIAILLSITERMFKKNAKNIKLAINILLLVILFFLVGPTPPTNRAIIMWGVSQLLSRLGLGADIRKIFVSTVIIMLLIDPFLVKSVSMQFTCGAVFGLVYLVPVLNSLTKRIHFPLKEQLVSSIAVNIIIYPIQVITFKNYSIAGLFTTIITSGLVEIIAVIGYPLALLVILIGLPAEFLTIAVFLVNLLLTFCEGISFLL